jgi:hypothetical protein
MAILGHPGRWLRHKLDGTIYNYNDILCNNPAVEEVSEELAFPERFIPEKQKGRKSEVDLSTDEDAVEDAKSQKGTRLKINATGKPQVRAHTADGKFASDDPSTPDKNEAFK